MKNDLDLLASQILHQNPPAANPRLAGSVSGAGGAGAGVSSSLVVVGEDGKPFVKRQWLMGDEWTENFYFKDWRTNDSD